MSGFAEAKICVEHFLQNLNILIFTVTIPVITTIIFFLQIMLNSIWREPFML